jgi:protein TonB
MLEVLLETNAARTKRVGGTLASTMVHGAFIAGAIALTVPHPRAAIAAPRDSTIIYVPIDRRPEPPAGPGQHQPIVGPVAPGPIAILPHVMPENPTTVGPIDDVPVNRPDDTIGPGVPRGGIAGPLDGLAGPIDGVVDEHLVDRAPRIVGRAVEPAFPASLRQSGRGGRVVAQFAVDTLGRAEMGGLKMVEETDPLFGEAVREVLPRYRFSPGEVRGRKVRTLVQLPFDFSVVR